MIYTLDLPRSAIGDASLPLDHGENIYIDKEQSGSRYTGTAYRSKILQLFLTNPAFERLAFIEQTTLAYLLVEPAPAEAEPAKGQTLFQTAESAVNRERL